MIVVMHPWSARFCHYYYFTFGVAGLVLIFVAEGILQLRVYVMYDCSFRLLVFNGVLFVVEIVLMVTFTILDTGRSTGRRCL